MTHLNSELLQHDTFVIEAMNESLVREAVGHYLGISLAARGVLTNTSIAGYLDTLADPGTTLKEKADYIRADYLCADDPTSSYSVAYKEYAELHA